MMTNFDHNLYMRHHLDTLVGIAVEIVVVEDN